MTRWLVVGGGAAGCVIAARLSEVESNDVVLLEAGPDHPASIGVPGAPVLDHPALLRPDTLVVRRRGAAPEPYAQGFGLGGSSLVNGAVVVGDPSGWTSGHDLPITPATDLGPIAARLVADPASGAAPVSLVARAGRRVSAADAYLVPASGRGNLTVRPGVSVVRLEFDGRRVVGAVTGTGEHIDVDGVVMCAGAIGTPELLLRSGVDTQGVGVGLQDHPGVAVSFDLRRGASDGVAIGATVERPGRQIVTMERLPARADMGVVVAGLMSVVSVGRVSLPDPDRPALVELDQLAHPDDLDGLAVAAREAIELVRSPELGDLVGDLYADADGHGIEAFESDETVFRQWISEHLGGYHHLAGSCRIGVALDPDGALRGYDGVVVADASALPGVPSRNPYLTVVRHAEVVAGRLRRR